MTIVARGDGSPVLELAEQSLDHISPGVGFAVDWIGRSPRGGRRYDGFDVALSEPCSQAVGVAGFVCQQSSRGGDGAQERNGHRYVRDISRG